MAALEKVVSFLQYQRGSLPEWNIEKPLKSSNLGACGVPSWMVNFIDIEQDLLFDTIYAANFLAITPLLHLCCGKVASMIKGLSRQKSTYTLV
jgi:hypothetical protein